MSCDRRADQALSCGAKAPAAAAAFLNKDRPVYLLAVLSKGQAANFTAEQIKALKAMMDRLRGA